MFYLFFLKYKDKFYNKSWRRLSLKEKIALIILVASGGSVTTLLIVNLIIPLQHLQYLLIALVIMIFDCIYIIRYATKRELVELDENIEKYKNERIKWVIDTLKHKNINLYSKEGIDWLIECCKEKIQRYDKGIGFHSFRITLLPLFTMCFGLLINKISSDEVITFTLIFAVILIGIEVLGSEIKSIIMKITLPDNVKYISLKEDLEYIKTQYSDIPPRSIILLSKEGKCKEETAL